LILTEGAVRFFNLIGQKRNVAVVQASETTGLDVPAPPAVTLSAVAAVTKSTSPVTEEAKAEETPVVEVAQEETPTEEVIGASDVTVNLQWSRGIR